MLSAEVYCLGGCGAWGIRTTVNAQPTYGLSAVAASFCLPDRAWSDDVLNGGKKWASKEGARLGRFRRILGVEVRDGRDYVAHPVPTGTDRLRKRGELRRPKQICFETLDE